MLLHVLCWLSIITRIAAEVDTKTVSIKSAADYLVTPACIQGCLTEGDSSIEYLIGCPSPFYNQCFCNLDQASSATSFLSSCVPISCSNSPAVSTAVSVYLNYCSGAGYPFQGGNTALQTSAQTEGGSNAVTATRSSVVTATTTAISGQPVSAVLSSSSPALSATAPTTTVWVNETSTSWTTEAPTGTEAARSGGGGGGGGYSMSDRIALGVGIGIGLPAALSGIVACWWTMIKRE